MVVAVAAGAEGGGHPGTPPIESAEFWSPWLRVLKVADTRLPLSTHELPRVVAVAAGAEGGGHLMPSRNT